MDIGTKVEQLLRNTNAPGLPSNLHPEMSLYSDLGLDSLALASLAFQVEEEFGVPFDELAARVADFRTVGDVVRILSELSG